MSAKIIDIPLDEPIRGHGDPVTTVKVREPSFAEYMKLGDPYLLVIGQNGTKHVTEIPDVMAEYCRICVVEPNILICEQGGLKLARKIRTAVQSFFQDVAEAGGGSTT